MFWGIALFIVLLAGTVTLWPLLRGQSSWKLPAVLSVLALPLIVYWLYQGVGTPVSLNPESMVQGVAPEGDMVELTNQLRQRLTDSPDDVEGWILLGRSYKTLQQYPEALEALETAQRLAPGQPLIVVELVEARLFASGNAQITPEMTALLEQAVSTDPTLQKGLWLLGIAAAQAGDDATAISWWERLLAQLEPNGSVSKTVSDQIAQARLRLGTVPQAATMPATTAGWPGLEISVELSVPANTSMPQLTESAVLFIIARQEGTTGGPPLGVRRIAQPEFPVQLTLTDNDSMMPQRPISASKGITLQARLSLTGVAAPAPGDWQSAPATVASGSDATTQLILDQKVE